mmetsp:Transcript_46734/g.120472  ORF Transcript_46734/g.120472 Transcript_46734/m.120472 type:complete len:110 (-) Transcript_46734:579-908(-)|eukprot:CAMPEP_0113881580 /NCGR_PEP_ID=MMETSP0780_2-20120614/8456_1 /TAXON_ID=652834 /ORGANISM="Palpitomonas bilix" /LENGTH=109 /DNA_ID=CAMNT_0000868455 /DNA_START=47 /DNA_END=376 /DNA_ORIENTATION=- /assembly_acc=CAM_ASM_000599
MALASLPLYTYIYAALLAVGGIIGYANKGSVVSLGAGVASACVLAFGGYSLSSPHSYKTGAYISIVTAVCLTIMMAQRFLSTGKFMPAGLVAVISLFMTGLYGNEIASM